MYGPVPDGSRAQTGDRDLGWRWIPDEDAAPEADAINFAPRVRVPVLMVNGRRDFVRPLEPSKAPLFRLLGTPAEHKRHAVLEGVHLPPMLQPMIREILDWLDRYLGPVRPKA